MNNSLIFYLAWREFQRQLPPALGHASPGHRPRIASHGLRSGWEAIDAARTTDHARGRTSQWTKLSSLITRTESVAPLHLYGEGTPTR